MTLERAFSIANRDVRDAAKLAQTAGMAATLVAAIVERGRVTIANVGDSRAYLWNPSGLRRLTADHRRVEELVRLGAVDRAALRAHPQRHLITRAIGMAPVVCPDVTEVPTARGDVLLLCSDGLSDVLADHAIAAACDAWRDPDDLTRNLLAAARAAGGSDDTSVVAACL